MLQHLQKCSWIFTKIAAFSYRLFAKRLRLQRCRSAQILQSLKNAVKRMFSCKISFRYSRERSRQNLANFEPRERVAARAEGGAIPAHPRRLNYEEDTVYRAQLDEICLCVHSISEFRSPVCDHQADEAVSWPASSDVFIFKNTINVMYVSKTSVWLSTKCQDVLETVLSSISIQISVTPSKVHDALWNSDKSPWNNWNCWLRKRKMWVAKLSVRIQSCKVNLL